MPALERKKKEARVPARRSSASETRTLPVLGFWRPVRESYLSGRRRRILGLGDHDTVVEVGETAGEGRWARPTVGASRRS